MAETHQFCPQCQAERTFSSRSSGQAPLRCPACGYLIRETAGADFKAAVKPASTTAAVKPAGTTVLHIDDDPVNRRVVAAFLEKGGFTTISASDGKSGLALAHQAKPSAVLLDVMMPDLDGYEVARRLRASPGLAHLAIIMLTGTDDPKLNAVAFKAGADMTIRKPFDTEKLLAVLRTALQLKRIQR